MGEDGSERNHRELYWVLLPFAVMSGGIYLVLDGLFGVSAGAIIFVGVSALMLLGLYELGSVAAAWTLKDSPEQKGKKRTRR